MAETVYESGWFRLANQAASSKDSIHDDETARELGFRRGFIPGTTISIAALAAIVEFYGKSWFEGGWHDLKFVDPAYDDEELQLRFQALDGSGAVRVAVVTREGRLTCSGAAGIGCPEFPEPPAGPWREVFPGSEPGTRFGAQAFTPRLRDYVSALQAAGGSAGEVAAWCRKPGSSPWGKALVPPAGLLPVTRKAQSQLPMDSARLPGMNGRMEVAYRAPVFVDEPLTASTWLAGKAHSERTWSRTIGFSLRDDRGAERAYGMHTIRWWAPD